MALITFGNYIWKLHFFKNQEHAKISKYSVSPSYCGPLHDTRRSKFFHRGFDDATLVNSKLI